MPSIRIAQTTRCQAPAIRGAEILCLVFLLGACDPDNPPFAPPDDGSPAECSIPETQIVSGGVGRDGIPALTNPEFVQAGSESGDYLRDFDRVIDIEVDGVHLAVPHNILWWHEIVNLTRAGRNLVATYCPLTGSSMVFDRGNADGAEFGVSGLLFRNNLMMYDRTSDPSLWPQMMRGARCGTRQGLTLEMYPAIEMRWDAWLQRHPDGLVVSANTGWRRDYQHYPYGDYEDIDNAYTLFPHQEFDNRRPPKERVLALPFPRGNGIAFPFRALDQRGDLGTAQVDADGDPVVVFWDRDAQAAAAYASDIDGRPLTFVVQDGLYTDLETGTRWDFEGRGVAGEFADERLRPVAEAYVAFWFAWSSFVPGTFLWLR